MGLKEAKESFIKTVKHSLRDLRLNELYKDYFCQTLKDDYDSKKEKWKKSQMKMYIVEEIGLKVDTKTSPGYIRLNQFENNTVPEYIENILEILILQQKKIKQLEEKISKLDLN